MLRAFVQKPDCLAQWTRDALEWWWRAKRGREVSFQGRCDACRAGWALESPGRSIARPGAQG